MATENSTTAGTPVFEVSWTEVRTITKTHRAHEIALDAGDAERRAKQAAGFSFAFLEQHLARLGWSVSAPIEPPRDDAHADIVSALQSLRSAVLEGNFFAVANAFEDGGYARVALAKVQS